MGRAKIRFFSDVGGQVFDKIYFAEETQSGEDLVKFKYEGDSDGEKTFTLLSVYSDRLEVEIDGAYRALYIYRSGEDYTGTLSSVYGSVPIEIKTNRLSIEKTDSMITVAAEYVSSVAGESSAGKLDIKILRG